MCSDSQAGSGGFAPGLYVVGTPIGNLQDLGMRARALIEAADVLAVEDTRVSGRLLPEGARQRMVTLTEHNVAKKTPELLEAAARGPVGLLSDAGTPGISDPGVRLVDAAHGAGVRVFAIPGPSALAAAVSVAGIDSSRVLFAGFAPRKPSERGQLLTEARGVATALVLFEGPNRVSSLLDSVADVYGDDCPVTLCRELTKVHEEVVHGTARALANRGGPERGECTLVVAVPPAPETREGALEMLAAMKRAGAQRSAAAAEVARATGLSRQELYEAWDAA